MARPITPAPRPASAATARLTNGGIDQRRRQVSHQRRGLHRRWRQRQLPARPMPAAETATGSSLTLQGTDAANYTLTAPTASATISARRRSPSPPPARARPTALAARSAGAGHDRASWPAVARSITATSPVGDAVDQRHQARPPGTITTPAPGPSRPRAASGSGVANYSITYTPNSGTLDIAQKALTDSGFAVNGKTYNAGTTASISSNGSLTRAAARPAATAKGGISPTTWSPSPAAAAPPSAQPMPAARPPPVAWTLQGTDAANYTLTAPTASATISARGDHHHRRQPEPDLRLWRHERGVLGHRLQQQWHDL